MLQLETKRLHTACELTSVCDKLRTTAAQRCALRTIHEAMLAYCPTIVAPMSAMSMPITMLSMR